jgi:hypothetical protein
MLNPSHPRLRRAVPERSGPIRNLLTSVHRIPASEWGPPSQPLRGALECGVQTAYAVIDEYMKRGYEAARNHNNYSDRRDHVNGKSNPQNERSGYGSWSSQWGPMTPFIEQWSMAMRAWTDAWSAFVPGMRAGAWPPPPFNAGGPVYPPPAQPSAVSVEVASNRPTEVTVNLKPGCELGDLTADSFVPALTHPVSITRTGGRLKVSVSVANEQAAGRYNGVIRASDGSIAGELTVAIAAAAPSA